jgi:DNA repair/transcription protein MET18/MMS19
MHPSLLEKPHFYSKFYQFIQLLLRGLELPNADIRADIIQVFISVANGGDAIHRIISEHATTLVSAMLLNSKHTDMPQPVCLTS